MSDENDDDKSFEPTERRLEQARQRGEIARSPDLLAAAALGGFLLAILIGGSGVLIHGGEIGQTLIARADRISIQIMAGGPAVVGPVLGAYSLALLPLFVVPFAAVLFVLVVQRGLIFTPDKLVPRLSRLSPIAAAKQKFGLDGLFSFAKSMAKMIAVGFALVIHLSMRANDIAASLALAAAGAIELMLQLMIEFLVIMLALAAVFGVADLFWQRYQHLKRNRMSRKEMMDETKESEGDPHAKGARRQRGQEIALNRMLQDVAKADVVIVNPTHYAVALRWKRSDKHAPVCVAKGVDEVAARIRERAALSGVPLHSDPPTARALFAAVEIGQPIQPEHYRPVAAAIRFSEALRQRRKGGV